MSLYLIEGVLENFQPDQIHDALDAITRLEMQKLLLEVIERHQSTPRVQCFFDLS